MGENRLLKQFIKMLVVTNAVSDEVKLWQGRALARFIRLSTSTACTRRA